ncbi:MAG: hypothetical protein HPZ79_00750 [Oscillospiraceae bacterium]|nr:hypothetical protein [Oscillospiraceae bacterium]
MVQTTLSCRCAAIHLVRSRLLPFKSETMVSDLLRKNGEMDVELPPTAEAKRNAPVLTTCAAEKILLGLQTCELSASSGQRVRCSQAAFPFVKKALLF